MFLALYKELDAGHGARFGRSQDVIVGRRPESVIVARVSCPHIGYTCFSFGFRYPSDAALSHDITTLRQTYGPLNAKLATQLTTLFDMRQKLCAFHITKFKTFGKKASVLAEVANSAIKGGNEFRSHHMLYGYTCSMLMPLMQSHS